MKIKLNRAISSDHTNPIVKTYRSTTFIKTSEIMTAKKMAIMIRIILNKRSESFVMFTERFVPYLSILLPTDVLRTACRVSAELRSEQKLCPNRLTL